MERKSTEHKTSGGRSYSLVEYITGGEGRFLGFMANDGNSVEKQEALQDKMIEVCVKSLEDSSENIVERVKNLPLVEYTEIVQQATTLFTGLDDQKKTK